jgi:plasmid stabilization system protein ParE
MTSRQIYFHPAAVEEPEATARWYRERSSRAAARFIDEINRVIDRLFDAPGRWPPGLHGTRKIRFPCFPFAVIYRESKEMIQILAVAHDRRQPGYWRARL